MRNEGDVSIGAFWRSVVGSVIGGSGRGAYGGGGAGWRGQKAIDILVRDSVLYYGVYVPFPFFLLPFPPRLAPC